MDLLKTGRLLCSLRKEKGLTQNTVADKLNICAKTVSKWETGHGFPDVSLLYRLSEILGVDTQKILTGNLEENLEEVGNMKRTKFYVCENCGSILTGVGETEISCCGRKLTPLKAMPVNEKHQLSVEKVEGDYYITFTHPMTKEHYISFVAYVRFDRVLLVKLYPEQGGEVRIPQMRGGKLYFYCNQHGLFEQK